MIVNRNVRDALGIRPQLRRKDLTSIAVFDREHCDWAKRPVWTSGQKPPSFTLDPWDGLCVRLGRQPKESSHE